MEKHHVFSHVFCGRKNESTLFCFTLSRRRLECRNDCLEAPVNFRESDAGILASAFLQEDGVEYDLTLIVRQNFMGRCTS